MATDRPLVLIVAGGTGGHLYPGIAIAHALVKGSVNSATPVDVSFVVRSGDLGRDILRREGFDVLDLPGQGLPRKLSPALLSFPVNLWRGFHRAKSLLQARQPKFVLGMGGYLSFPVLFAAHLKGISTMIHEQNMLPGLTNRLLGRVVDSVAVSFPESVRRFPAKKAWTSGLPIREGIRPRDARAARSELGLNVDMQTVLVFGGSQGAHRLNDAVVETWRRLGAAARSWQVIHIAGPTDERAIAHAYRELGISSRVIGYSHDMPAMYAAADVVICRSGASTIAELLAVQRRAILIPFPHATADHQYFNAQVLERRGLASIVREKDLTPERLGQELTKAFERIQSPGGSEIPSLDVSHASAAHRVAEFIGARIGVKLL